MDPRDKEKALEKLLPPALRATLKPGGAECPEADLLAAYAERALSASEAARWEEHFSTCARCQEVLAVFARSEEAFAAERELRVAAAAVAAPARSKPAQEGAPKPWRLFDWRWLVPAVAAAAAVAVWIAVRPVPPRTTGIETARNDKAITLPSTPAQITPSAPAPSSEAAVPKKEKTVGAKSHVDRLLTKNVGGAGLTARAERAKSPEPAAKLAAVTPATPPQAAPSLEGRAVARSLARAQEADRTAKNEPKQKSAQVQEKSPSASGQTESVMAYEVAGNAAKKSDDQKKAASSTGGRARNAALGKLEGEATPGMAYQQVAPGPRIILVATQDRSVMWRVGAAGLIEHSSDGGQTWQTQTSNVQAELLAGSAPAEEICWVVGRAGTILRTTDGEHWEKIAPPVPLDYVGVTASDALHAVVLAEGGKRFRTADGGRAWASVPKE
jgi:hypothetical protein